MTAEKLELSARLGAVAVKSDKRFKELAVVRSACDRVEGLVPLTVARSVKALNAFVNQVGTQLVSCFRTGLENEYAGSQLAFLYTLTNASGV